MKIIINLIKKNKLIINAKLENTLWIYLLKNNLKFLIINKEINKKNRYILWNRILKWYHNSIFLFIAPIAAVE